MPDLYILSAHRPPEPKALSDFRTRSPPKRPLPLAVVRPDGLSRRRIFAETPSSSIGISTLRQDRTI